MQQLERRGEGARPRREDWAGDPWWWDGSSWGFWGEGGSSWHGSSNQWGEVRWGGEGGAAGEVVEGPVVTEVRQVYSAWTTHVIRLHAGQPYVELEWTAGPIPIDTPWYDAVATNGSAPLRELALKALEDTGFTPPSGRNRITSMVADRPDWLISRQRNWGVPITIFVNKSGQPHTAALEAEQADALNNAINDEIIVQRFHADALVQSADLLLQEKIPTYPVLRYPETERDENATPPTTHSDSTTPWNVSWDTAFPYVHTLSNGHYSVLMTNTGGGFSQWRATSLTQFTPDPALDESGTWVYIQDMDLHRSKKCAGATPNSDNSQDRN